MCLRPDRRLSYGAYRAFPKCAGAFTHGFSAGSFWQGQCVQSVRGDRTDRLDEYGEGGADGGSAAETHGLCAGGKVSWRRFLSCAVPASGTQFLSVRSVYCRYECEKRNRGGVHAEFYGTGTSGGRGFLGQHIVLVKKRTSLPFVVDHSDSRRLFGGNPALPDKSGQLYERECQ